MFIKLLKYRFPIPNFIRPAVEKDIVQWTNIIVILLYERFYWTDNFIEWSILLNEQFISEQWENEQSREKMNCHF